ncbi:MAG: DUF421 domain-containing protein [Sphingomonadaceae bacterium]
MFFDGWPDIVRVSLITLCAYAGLIVILRVAGKRSLSKLNAFDFVVTVALGSTLATVLLSKEVSLAEGVLALALLAGLQYLVTRLSLGFSWFRGLVRSDPALLVEKGRYLEEMMKRERVTRGELDQAIRNEGIGRIEDVDAVVLETDGSFSVIRAGEGGELTSLRSVHGPDEGPRD